MATSVGRIYLTGCNYELAYDLLSQSSENNTSKVRLYGILHVTNNYVSWSSGTASIHTESAGIGTYYSKGDHIVIQRDFTWGHDSNGNFSATIGYGLITTFVSGSSSGVITLPKISRFATITETPSSLTDEGTPYIKFTNPGNATNLNVWLEVNPNGTHYATRNLSITSGTYTWELTEAERNQLRAVIPNSNNATIRLGLQSTQGSTTGASYKDIPFSIVNANPTFTYTNTEINSAVSALLGTSASTVVQNASRVRFVITPTALKSSTITKVQIIHGDKTYTDTTSPYQIDIPVTTNTFTIKVTDSRGNYTTQTITKTLITYKPVDVTTLTMKRQNQTSSNIILNLETVYYQKTFGSTANVPVVKLKLNNGSYTTIPSSNYTIDTTNNKLTITNYTLSNALVYTSSGTFTIQISDKLTSDTDARDILKGVATFEAGEHDLQVNGDLFIADTNRNNIWNVGDTILGVKGKVLWTNPNPTIDFPQQDIILNSSDYDILDIYYKSAKGNNYMLHKRTLKGYSTILLSASIAVSPYVQRRYFDYVNDTKYNVKGMEGAWGGDQGNLIPIYIIGYKSNLFN